MTTLPVLRRSAIQTARSCLHRYKAIWVDGAPDQSEPSLVGIGFHACANHYVQRLVAAKLESDDEESKLAFPEGIATALTPPNLVPEIRRIYYGWVRDFSVDLGAFLAAEERQTGKTGHQFAPDLVYGRKTELEVKDFKTFRVGMTETQVRNDFQARFYIYNAMRIWPNFPAYRFTQEYVRYGTFTSVVFEPSELDTFAEEVEAVAAMLDEATRRNEWPATPGKECGFCELQCPVADNPMLVPSRLLTPQQAVLLGEYVLAGESVMKKAKKTLKAWAAANGPVNVAGVEFDNRPSLQRAYPIAEVTSALAKWGKAGAFETDGLTVSHSALAKLFKKYPELEQELAQFVQAKTTYRFSAKKPGVGDDEEE